MAVLLRIEGALSFGVLLRVKRLKLWREYVRSAARPVGPAFLVLVQAGSRGRVIPQGASSAGVYMRYLPYEYLSFSKK